jgi:hypothetical protein
MESEAAIEGQALPLLSTDKMDVFDQFEIQTQKNDRLDCLCLYQNTVVLVWVVEYSLWSGQEDSENCEEDIDYLFEEPACVLFDSFVYVYFWIGAWIRVMQRLVQ